MFCIVASVEDPIVYPKWNNKYKNNKEYDLQCVPNFRSTCTCTRDNKTFRITCIYLYGTCIMQAMFIYLRHWG
jgi:hypothetical protein